MGIASRRHADDEVIPPGMLDISTRRLDGTWRVTLRGELAIETVEATEKELDRLAPHPVVLDLSGVTFIDSVGLTLLVRRAKQNVVLETVSGEVDRIIRLCGLETELRTA
jgi:anti-anti-sigma factor